MAARFLVVFILCAVAAWAQAQPAEPAAGSVAGVVMDALTHAPLADVPVHADGSTATTDLAGRFAFPRLEPGRHWISVYEERRALSAGVYVLVSAGQEVTGVEIYVKLGGAISGTVVVKETFIGPGTASPCSNLSAINRSASASTAAVACFLVRPYAVTPGSAAMSASQRPSSSRKYSMAREKPVEAVGMTPSCHQILRSGSGN
ncbi:MAG: carboxypeptidase-like regulatory domain-containing protein [Bryobacteraceae bacterium]